MDSEKQSEGFEGAGGGRLGGARWWVLRRAHIAWSTGCGERTMNTVTLKRKKKRMSPGFSRFIRHQNCLEGC